MARKETMINNMTSGNVVKQLLTFAYPFMLSNLLQVVYTLVDMIVVGQFVGSRGLSGVAIGGEICMLFTMLCFGFTSAGQIMVSQYVGQDDRESIKKTIGTMFTSVALIGAVITVISLSCVDWLLGLMNTPAESYDQARNYSVVCFIGTLFTYGYNTVGSVLRGMGDSKRPFLFVAIAAVLNLILDLIFVAVFHMDTMGAALATVIGQAVSFIIAIIYLYRRKEAFGFDFKLKSFAIDGAKLKPMLKLGLPMALQFGAISISMLYVNSLVNAAGGVSASAVAGVGGKINNVMSIVSQSIGTAASAMIGQNIAARRTDRVSRITWVSFSICIVCAVVLAVAFLLFPEQVFGIFNSDPEVLAYAPFYSVVGAVGFVSFAIISPFNSLINGIGHATLALIIALLDGVVARVGFVLLFGVAMDFGVKGMWMGSACAGFVSGILSLIYFLSGKWKERKLLIE